VEYKRYVVFHVTGEGYVEYADIDDITFEWHKDIDGAKEFVSEEQAFNAVAFIKANSMSDPQVMEITYTTYATTKILY
jgi:hypothetical protein